MEKTSRTSHTNNNKSDSVFKIEPRLLGYIGKGIINQELREVFRRHGFQISKVAVVIKDEDFFSIQNIYKPNKYRITYTDAFVVYKETRKLYDKTLLELCKSKDSEKKEMEKKDTSVKVPNKLAGAIQILFPSSGFSLSKGKALMIEHGLSIIQHLFQKELEDIEKGRYQKLRMALKDRYIADGVLGKYRKIGISQEHLESLHFPKYLEGVIEKLTKLLHCFDFVIIVSSICFSLRTIKHHGTEGLPEALEDIISIAEEYCVLFERLVNEIHEKYKEDGI